MNNYAIITALTNVFSSNRVVRRTGLWLIHEPSEDGVNEVLTVRNRGVDTAFYIMVGHGQATLNSMDDEGENYHATMESFGATNMLAFVEEIVNIVKESIV